MVTSRSGAELQLVQGDITLEQVDAVVNAANRHLAGGGGVDGALHRAAGVSQLQAACRAIGGCDPGQAVVTEGFNLPAQWIIHTVGPVWNGGHQDEAVTLASCYRNCLARADDLGVRSISFPAISTGVYGYPMGEAAAIAVSTVCDAPTGVTLVRFVAFDEDTLAAYRQLL